MKDAPPTDEHNAADSADEQSPEAEQQHAAPADDEAGQQHAAPADDEAGQQHVAPADDEAGIDPELAQLPAPRRRRRHPLISGLVILLSLYVIFSLRTDVGFFFQPNKARDLGQVSEALAKGTLRHNTHVSLVGAPDRKRALILEGRMGGYESFFRLLDSQNRVFVQQHRELRSSDREVTSRHTGQLVRFESLPYADSLRAYLSKSVNVAHDLPMDAVLAARAAGKDQVTLKDKRGQSVTLGPSTVVWLSVAPENRWVVQFRKSAYPTAAEAEKQMQPLELPYARDTERSQMFWAFVVHAEPDQLPLLTARFRDRSRSAEVVRRQLSYTARWDQMGVQGGTLLLNVADPSAPTRFQLQAGKDDERGRLVPHKPQPPLRLSRKSVLYAETSSPLQVSPGAMVLIAGEKPADKWLYLLITGVLGLFALVNAISLILRLRERSAS